MVLYKNCLMGFGFWGWLNHPQGPQGGLANFFIFIFLKKNRIILLFLNNF